MNGTHVNDKNPYVGPHAITDPKKFYGREREVRELIELLIPGRIVLLHSPSGAGKTSLIQSALIPEIKNRGFRILPRIRVGGELPEGLNPSDRRANSYVLHTLLSLEERKQQERERVPIEKLCETRLPEYFKELAVEVAAGEAVKADDLVAPSGKRLTGKALLDYVSKLNKARAQDQGDENFLLIFDQFEEILTLNPTDLKSKMEFFRQLGEALEDDRFWALFSMREDYVAALSPYLRHVPTRLNKGYRLDLLGAHAALRAVQKPSEDSPVRFTDRAARILVNDLRKLKVQQPGGEVVEKRGLYVEPVHLQVVCRRLWAQKFEELQRAVPPRTELYIQKQDIKRGSGVNEALSAYYAEQVEKIAADTGDSRRKIRAWIENKLITEDGFRRPARSIPEGGDGPKPETIRQLIDAYLLREERRHNVIWLELAHDRLVEPIRISNRESLQPFQVAAAHWQESGAREDLLLGGAELTAALGWLDEHPQEVTREEKEFVDAGVEAQRRVEAEQRRRYSARRERIRKKKVRQRHLRTRFRVITIIVAVICILAFGGIAAAAALWKVQAQAKISQVRTLIDYSSRHPGTVAELRLLMSLHALAEAEKLKYGWFYRVLGIAEETEQVKTEAVNELFNAVQTSQVWATLADESGPVYDLDFSPDGNLIVTGSEGGELTLWDAISGQPVRTLDSGPSAVNALAYSPARDSEGGTRIADVREDGTAWLWTLDGQNAVVEKLALPRHEGRATSVAFTPDGRLVATGGADKKVNVWDVGGRRLLASFERTAGVRSVAFNHDGRCLAAATAGGGGASTVVMWDVASGRMTGLDTRGAVNALAFDNPTTEEGKQKYGRYLATGGDGGVIEVWDTGVCGEGKLDEPRVLRDQNLVGSVNAVAFSRDGEYFGTAGEDHLIRVWNIVDGANWTTSAGRKVFEVNAHALPVRGIAFGPDVGPLSINIASASDDGTAKLLSVNPGNYPRAMDVAFTRPKWPDKQEEGQPFRVATIGTEGTVFVYTVNAVQNPYFFYRRRDDLSKCQATNGQSRTPQIRGIAYRPGTEVVAIGDQCGVTLWNALTGLKIESPPSFDHPGLRSMAFSSDGERIATAGDGDVQVWDVLSGRHLFTLKGHSAAVNRVVFHPEDRSVLASADDGGRIILWRTPDAKSEPDPQTLSVSPAELVSPSDIVAAHGNKRVLALDMSHDGRYLATGGEDKTLAIWQVVKSPDALTLRPFGPEPVEYRGAVKDLAFKTVMPAADGGEYTLAVASGDGQLELRSFGGNSGPLSIADEPGGMQAVSFSPDGEKIAAIGSDRISHVYLTKKPTDKDRDVIVALARRWITRSWSDAECKKYLEDTPEQCRREFSILNKLAEANRFAKAGEVEKAVALFREVSSRASEYPVIDVGTNVEVETKEIMTQSQGTKGYNYLNVGDEQRACETFAKMEGAFELFEAGRYISEKGRVKCALTLYEKADRILNETRNPPQNRGTSYNALCWYGSWWSLREIREGASAQRVREEQLPKILGYCESAVSANKDELSFVDSRGVARAIVGRYGGDAEDVSKYEEAAQDFEKYMPQASKEEKEERMRWIEALRRRSFPFTEEDLNNYTK